MYKAKNEIILYNLPDTAKQNLVLSETDLDNRQMIVLHKFGVTIVDWF